MSVSGGYPAAGESIGPYRIVRRIGGGGMGVVFEADDESLHRKVALKVISPHLAESDDFRARFTREAQAQASLDSAHVVHVYAHGVDEGGRLYIAAQLVPDGDLGQMLQSYGAPPVRVALDLMAQVADGLADAHAVGLIHRDIKPANVLLRRREHAVQAYLSDFGIARQVAAEQTRSGTGTVGTPSYMAPELHTGGGPSVESDVYSLGCLLWATLTGRAPYTGTSEYQVVSAHLEQPIPQLDDDGPMTAEVNRILRRAMAKQRAERYHSAAELRDDLRRAGALPEAPSAATPAPTGHSRRRSALVVAGAVVLVAVLSGGIAYVVLRGGDEPAADPPDPSASRASSPAPVPSDEDAAVASLTDALEAVMTPAQAACAARAWVENAGLQTMIEAGMFEEDMTYVDRDRADLPAKVTTAGDQAAIGCATAE